MGKQLIIVGADFSAVAIDSRQQVPITVPASLTIADVGGTASLSYSSTVSVASWTITSNNTSIATVASSGNPRTITGVATGNTTISVTATPSDTTTYRPTTKTVALTVSSVVPGDYTITTSVTHGSYTGATSISPSGTATVTISPDTDYVLPSSVTVSGATQNYNSSTGVISLSNPTSNVIISAVCTQSGERTYTIGETLQFDNMTEVASTKITESYYSGSTGNTLSIESRSGYKGWKNIKIYAGQTYEFNGDFRLMCFYDSNELIINSFNLKNTYPDGRPPATSVDCWVSVTATSTLSDSSCTIKRLT